MKCITVNTSPGLKQMLQYGGLTKANKDTNSNGFSMELARHELRLIESHGNAVRFYERSANQFEVYCHQSVSLVVQALHMSSSSIQHVQLENFSSINAPKDGRVACISLQEPQAAAAMTELVMQCRVELWRQNRGLNWQTVMTASPGNISQLEAYLQNADPSSMQVVSSAVIALIYGTVGVVFDELQHKFVHVSNLCSNADVEVFLVQTDPKECLFLSKMNPQLDELLQFCGQGIVSSSLSNVNCSLDGAGILRQLQTMVFAEAHSKELSLMDETLLMALWMVCEYVGLFKSSSVMLRLFAIEKMNLSGLMRLDDTALKALNVFGSSEKKSATTSNLFGVLNHCRTKAGSRLLAQWLRQPLTDVDLINRRLDMVESFVKHSAMRVELADQALRGIGDISRINLRLMRNKASLQDLVMLYDSICKLSMVDRVISAFGLVTAPTAAAVETSKPFNAMESYVEQVRVVLGQLGKFCELVEGVLDFSALDRHEYLVRPDFDPQLTELQCKKDTILMAMDPIACSVARDLKLEFGKRLKLVHGSSVHGHHLRVTRADGQAVLKSTSNQYIELATNKTGVMFTTAELRDLNDVYEQVVVEYGKAQSALVSEMMAVARTYWHVFDQMQSLLAVIDVYQSLAHAAAIAPIPYVRPELIDGDENAISLKQARHPCIEILPLNRMTGGVLATGDGGDLSSSNLQMTQLGPSFVANDVDFGEKLMYLITGPNMGGKSTYIRTAALMVLMAQMGSFVPCQSARIVIRDALLVRVGAGDSLRRGLSTFMMEMTETASILKQCTSKSLVVVDELGRGTSTTEGFGIAWGVCKQLLRAQCLTLFATHFHELCALETENESVGNLHAVAEMVDDERIVMTFAIRPGACDRSFGLQVARMAGFPYSVVDLANLYLTPLDDDCVDLKAALEDLEAGKSSDLVRRICPLLASKFAV